MTNTKGKKMKPHKHSEVIKAWADGKSIEYMSESEKQWLDATDTPGWYENVQYRIKPEPDYPKTKMAYDELKEAYFVFGSKNFGLTSWHSEAAENLANAAIRRATQDGDVILPNKE